MEPHRQAGSRPAWLGGHACTTQPGIAWLGGHACTTQPGLAWLGGHAVQSLPACRPAGPHTHMGLLATAQVRRVGSSACVMRRRGWEETGKGMGEST